MKLVNNSNMSKAEVESTVKELTDAKISKGECIRRLFKGGLDVKDIAAVTNIRYNHVYNVVRNEILTKGLEVEQTGRNSENSKKNQILTMLAEGKSITEVSKELKCLYNYVWQIAKAAGYTKKPEQTETKDAAKPVSHKKNTKKENVVA
jgi:transposase-like protein